MRSRRMLALVLLGLSTSTSAEFRTITEAYELTLGDLRLPGSVVGTLTFKRCAECEAQIARVTSKTRYVINNRDFALTEFKKQLIGVRYQSDAHVSVLHHLESNTIKAVKVWH